MPPASKTLTRGRDVGCARLSAFAEGTVMTCAERFARRARSARRAAPLSRLSARASHAQVPYDRILRAAAEPQNWLTYNGTLQQPALQHARADHAGQRRRTSSRSGCCRTRCSAPGSRTRSSSTASCTSRSGRTTSWPSTRRPGRVFWLYRHTPSPDARGLLRRQQPRRRDPRRHALHGHARRASDRASMRRPARPLWNVAGRRRRSSPTRSRWRRSSSRTR